MTHESGRHFLQIPGPTNVPDRVLRAIDQPTIDHRGPEFAALGLEILGELPQIFGTEHPVIIYPSSGTGAWEAALVNALSPGDRVLMCETGQFAVLWQQLAARLGLDPQVLPTDWRHGADPEAIEAALSGRHRARDQGRLHRAQRDLDGRRRAASAKYARPSTGHNTRRSSWSTRSRRSPRSTTAWTNGAST